jgi:hypothetical protein
VPTTFPVQQLCSFGTAQHDDLGQVQTRVSEPLKAHLQAAVIVDNRRYSMVRIAAEAGLVASWLDLARC